MKPGEIGRGNLHEHVSVHMSDREVEEWLQ